MKLITVFRCTLQYIILASFYFGRLTLSHQIVWWVLNLAKSQFLLILEIFYFGGIAEETYDVSIQHLAIIINICEFLI